MYYQIYLNHCVTFFDCIVPYSFQWFPRQLFNFDHLVCKVLSYFTVNTLSQLNLFLFWKNICACAKSCQCNDVLYTVEFSVFPVIESLWIELWERLHLLWCILCRFPNRALPPRGPNTVTDKTKRYCVLSHKRYILHFLLVQIYSRGLGLWVLDLDFCSCAFSLTVWPWKWTGIVIFIFVLCLFMILLPYSFCFFCQKGSCKIKGFYWWWN